MPLSRVKSRSRQEATEADSVVSEIVSSLGQISEMNPPNLLLLKEIRHYLYEHNKNGEHGTGDNKNGGDEKIAE